MKAGYASQSKTKEAEGKKIPGLNEKAEDTPKGENKCVKDASSQREGAGGAGRGGVVPEKMGENAEGRTAEQWKAEGNLCYQNGEWQKAIEV